MTSLLCRGSQLQTHWFLLKVYIYIQNMTHKNVVLSNQEKKEQGNGAVVGHCSPLQKCSFVFAVH